MLVAAAKINQSSIVPAFDQTSVRKENTHLKVVLECLRERGDFSILYSNSNSTGSNSKNTISQDHVDGFG
jgi:hypothetical protein